MRKIEKYFYGRLLHDIGALSLENKLSLRNYEFEGIDHHCIRGNNLLRAIPWFEDAAKIIRFHHKECHEWNESINIPDGFDAQLLFFADYVERATMRNKPRFRNRNLTPIAGELG